MLKLLPPTWPPIVALGAVVPLAAELLLGPKISYYSSSGVRCKWREPIPESLNFYLISGLTNLRSIRSLSMSGYPVSKSVNPC